MLFPFLACTDQPLNGPGDTADSTPGADDSATGSTDDSGTSAKDDSGTDDSATDDSATDDSATDDSGDDTGPKPWLVPDFALVDLNTSSPTYGHTISPREHKGHVSGWYFIHAT